MKRICILHALLIVLYITTTSWAFVNINQGHLTGFLGVDNNPIIKVLNFDGTIGVNLGIVSWYFVNIL